MQPHKTEAKILRAEGMSYTEIGRILGYGKQTIRRWLTPGAEEQHRENSKYYYLKNRDQKLLDRHNRYLSNRDHELLRHKIYHRHKRQTDLNFKLRANLRTRLYCAIRTHQKTGSAIADLGRSITRLKEHLESQFEEGMTWENYGQWHIDHIKPLAWFDLTDRGQLLEACHYSNLQPLWAKDNSSKGSKYAVA